MKFQLEHRQALTELIMKWFKHHSDAHSNLKTGSVIAEHGVKGYGFWWLCVELIASQGEDYALGADKNWKKGLVRESGLTMEEVDHLLAFFADERLIDAEALARAELYIPNLAEYCDDYSSRGKTTNTLRRKSEKVGESTEVSEKVALEEKRREENRKEEGKPHTRLGYLIQIPADDLKELSQKFEASNQQIQRKAEELHNYCLAKGRVYKNYRAFLENALQKDFGRRTSPKIVRYEQTERGMKPIYDEDYKKFPSSPFAKGLGESKRV